MGGGGKLVGGAMRRKEALVEQDSFLCSVPSSVFVEFRLVSPCTCGRVRCEWFVRSGYPDALFHRRRG